LHVPTHSQLLRRASTGGGPAFALFAFFAFSFSFNGYHAVDVGLQQEMCNAWNKISAFDLNGILLTDTTTNQPLLL
jgi:hypothetical protein